MTTEKTNGGPITVALVALEAKHTADLLAETTRRIDERDKIREEHRIENAASEKARIDANAEKERLRVDAVSAADRAAAVLVASEAKATASALAVQAETTRRALEAQVEATRATNALVVEATAKALGERIAPLEQARFAAVGVREQRVEGRQSNAALYAAVGFGITVLLFVMAVVTFVLARAT